MSATFERRNTATTIVRDDGTMYQLTVVALATPICYHRTTPFLTLFTRASAPHPAKFPAIAPATHGTTLAPELWPRLRWNS